MATMTEQRMQSKNGTIHVVEWAYVSQSGHTVYMGLCNKGYVGSIVDGIAVTCKLCAKRAQ